MVDAIVVGLGAMGSATAYQLAARGASVVGIDRFEPPHPYGSTYGETRITRLAVGEGREYVPLVARSHELWARIEAETATHLFTTTGGLVIGHPSSPFLARTRALAAQFGIAHENIPAGELRERFPMFVLADDLEGYHERDAGYVRPEAAVRAQLALAARHGADLRLGETVTGWRADSHGVSVTTDSDVLRAGQLILCAGPWLPELLDGDEDLFAVYRQTQFWFAIRDGYEQLSRMPIFVWDFGEMRDAFVHLHGFYGFPAVDGPDGGLKVATERYEQTTVPDGRAHPAMPFDTEAMYRDYIATRIPWLGPDPVRTRTCLYTSTPDSRFIIDRHPGHANVLVVSACSGHGFKHSAAIGEAAAQWVTDGAPGIDLGAFGWPAR